MVFIRLSEKCDARGFLVLAKSGFPIVCLPDNVYGVGKEQLKLLKQQKMSYKTLPANSVRLPKVSLAA
jgi:hypothetical protein